MNKILSGLVAILLLAPVTVLAAGNGGHHAPSFDSHFFFSLINFTLLVLVMFFAIKKPVREFFRKRSSTTKIEMERAKKYYDEVSHKMNDINGRLSRADEEGKQLVESLRIEGEQEKAALIRQAQELAVKIKADAQRIIEQETKKAREALKAETVTLAADLASNHLKSSLTAQDHEMLGQEFVAQLAGLSKPN